MPRARLRGRRVQIGEPAEVAARERWIGAEPLGQCPTEDPRRARLLDHVEHLTPVRPRDGDDRGAHDEMGEQHDREPPTQKNGIVVKVRSDPVNS